MKRRALSCLFVDVSATFSPARVPRSRCQWFFMISPNVARPFRRSISCTAFLGTLLGRLGVRAAFGDLLLWAGLRWLSPAEHARLCRTTAAWVVVAVPSVLFIVVLAARFVRRHRER
jgi:hypothetical protein